MSVTMSHCFVTRGDYDEFRRISVDGDSMPAEYDVFASNVQQFLDRIQNQGGAAVKMYIKPAELLAWCRAQGRDVDSNSRAEYAARCHMDSMKEQDSG